MIVIGIADAVFVIGAEGEPTPRRRIKSNAPLALLIVSVGIAQEGTAAEGSQWSGSIILIFELANVVLFETGLSEHDCKRNFGISQSQVLRHFGLIQVRLHDRRQQGEGGWHIRVAAIQANSSGALLAHPLALHTSRKTQAFYGHNQAAEAC